LVAGSGGVVVLSRSHLEVDQFERVAPLLLLFAIVVQVLPQSLLPCVELATQLFLVLD
jgi:hypothetical protein